MEFENLKNIAKKAGFSNEFTTEQAITNIEDDVEETN